MGVFWRNTGNDDPFLLTVADEVLLRIVPANMCQLQQLLINGPIEMCKNQQSSRSPWPEQVRMQLYLVCGRWHTAVAEQVANGLAVEVGHA
jgi:hypothetical protein